MMPSISGFELLAFLYQETDTVFVNVPGHTIPPVIQRCGCNQEPMFLLELESGLECAWYPLSSWLDFKRPTVSN